MSQSATPVTKHIGGARVTGLSEEDITPCPQGTRCLIEETHEEIRACGGDVSVPMEGVIRGSVVVHGGQRVPPEATWGRRRCGGWGLTDAWQRPWDKAGRLCQAVAWPTEGQVCLEGRAAGWRR